MQLSRSFATMRNKWQHAPAFPLYLEHPRTIRLAGSLYCIFLAMSCRQSHNEEEPMPRANGRLLREPWFYALGTKVKNLGTQPTRSRLDAIISNLPTWVGGPVVLRMWRPKPGKISKFLFSKSQNQRSEPPTSRMKTKSTKIQSPKFTIEFWLGEFLLPDLLFEPGRPGWRLTNASLFEPNIEIN